MAKSRHQVGDQQKRQRLRGDDRGATACRLRGHVHQCARVRVDHTDRPIGGDEHRLHRFGQPVAADRYLRHCYSRVRQLRHQHPGQNQLRNQGQWNDRGCLVSRIGERRDHQAHRGARQRTDREQQELLQPIAGNAVRQCGGKHIDNGKLQYREYAGRDIFRADERRGGQVDVVLATIDRKLTDDVLRCRVAS